MPITQTTQDKVKDFLSSLSPDEYTQEITMIRLARLIADPIDLETLSFLTKSRVYSFCDSILKAHDPNISQQMKIHHIIYASNLSGPLVQEYQQLMKRESHG